MPNSLSSQDVSTIVDAVNPQITNPSDLFSESEVQNMEFTDREIYLLELLAAYARAHN